MHVCTHKGGGGGERGGGEEGEKVGHTQTHQIFSLSLSLYIYI